ncbi:MAG: hypothetical protein N2322_07335 [Terrimicrobiaceae bacterium]|nr:hypothetical protein [Terrimicrobiaceae bacterium]
MIRCQACSHENDDTRVFCQNCGIRLEVEGAKVPAAEPERRIHISRKAPVRRQINWFRPAWLLLRELLWTVALGAILACLIQAMRPPDGVPPAVQPRPALASLLAADAQSAIASAYPRTLEVSEQAANNFLASRVQGVESSPLVLKAKLARTFASFGQGRAVFGVEQRLGGHPVYLRLVIRPVREGGRMRAVAESGSMGRLRVPSFLLPAFEKSFRPVFEALEDPISWLSQAEAISISPGVAVVSWRGSRD